MSPPARSEFVVPFLRDSGKNSLFSPLLGEDGSRFVLGIWVVGQLWRAGGHWALKDGLLEVVEDSRILLGDE